MRKAIFTPKTASSREYFVAVVRAGGREEGSLEVVVCIYDNITKLTYLGSKRLIT